MLNRREAGWEGERLVKGWYEKTIVFAHGSAIGLAGMSGP
jgi:hypothetical protein